MKGLNLSKLKKVGEDNNTTTFKHSDGHNVTIAHAKLSPKMREELKRLPLHAAEGAVTGNSADNAVTSNQTNPQDESQPDQPPSQDAQTPAQPNDIDSGSPENTQEQNVGPSPASTNPEAQAQTPYQPMTPAQKDTQETLADMRAYQNDAAAGHIKPETYSQLFEGKDTLGKIGTLFGLMISGAGSGMSHQNNMVMQMMDNELQRNFEAQKANAANGQNFYNSLMQHELNKANEKYLGAQTQRVQAEIPYTKALTEKAQAEIPLTQAQVAETKARTGVIPAQGKAYQAQANMANAEAALKTQAKFQSAQNWSTLQHLANMATKLPPGSPQQAQAQSSLGLMFPMLQQKDYNMAATAAGAIDYYKTLSGAQVQQGANPEDMEQSFAQRQGRLQIMGPQGKQRSEYEESHHLPGVSGFSTKPETANDVDTYQRLQNIDKAYADAENYLKNVGTLGEPIPGGQRSKGQAISTRITNEMGQLSGINRYTTLEDEKFGSRTPDLAGTHFTDQDAAKLQELRTELHEHMQDFVESHGLKMPKQEAQQQSSKYPEGSIARDANGKPGYIRRGNKWVPYGGK